MPEVVTLCTGNAARSVIAGAFLADMLPEGEGGVAVKTRGTHVIEGLPMSWRTAEAIRGFGLGRGDHRSRQLASVDLERADLVLAMAGEHVQYVRRHHPTAAARTATLKRLARDLPQARGTFQQRIAGLGLADVVLEPWEDVDDPAGGDVEVFHHCAAEIHALLACITPLVRGVPACNDPA